MTTTEQSPNEAKAAAFRAEQRDNDGTREGLEQCARMLDTYAPELYPANEHGQVSFSRAMMESTADEIRAFLAADAGFVAGAQACREMMARFVEQGGDTVTAESIRANWSPAWGADPARPGQGKTFSELSRIQVDPNWGRV